MGWAYPGRNQFWPRPRTRCGETSSTHDWFVDRLPVDDSEFTTPGKVVGNRIDLVSVVAHELGHIAGLDHDGDAKDVMGELLAAGTRRVPTASDAKLAEIAGGTPTAPVAMAHFIRHRSVRRR